MRTAALEVLASRDRRRGAWKVNQPDRWGDAERLEEQVAGLYGQLDDIEGLWLACSVKDGAARERFARWRRATETSLASAKAGLGALTVRSRHSELDKLHSNGRGACDAFLVAPAHLKVTIQHELIERVVLSPAPEEQVAPGPGRDPMGRLLRAPPRPCGTPFSS